MLHKLRMMYAYAGAMLGKQPLMELNVIFIVRWFKVENLSLVCFLKLMLAHLSHFVKYK